MVERKHISTGDLVVLVTGADKFIGTQVVRRLSEQEYAVYALQRSIGGAYPFTHPLVRLITIDLAQLSEQEIDALIATLKPDVLIHCDAITDVAFCEMRPSQAYVVNTAITRLVARACANHSVHCTFVSTDYVFDGLVLPLHRYTEEDQTHPQTFYGVSKLQGELAVQEECSERTGWTICRSSLVYGALQDTGEDYALSLLSSVRQQKTVQVIYDLVFSPTWVEDLASMIVELALRRAQGIYHTAGSSVVDQYTFARQLINLHGYHENLIVPISYKQAQSKLLRPKFEFWRPKPLGPQCAGLSIEKVQTTLRHPPLSLEEGMFYWYYRLHAC
jgi:dTDP-4-dehydrorhamnose reductase